MRAFVITGPGKAEVQDVIPPEPQPGEVVVDVERAGVCGTDIEFFAGGMSYLHTGQARYPIRIGHEWAGTVSTVGDGVDPSWTGRRVTGDTMLGTRVLALKDVTAVGVLSASGGIAGTVELYASGAVDPRPLIAATVGLDDIAAVLAGEHRPEWGDAPKIHVDPRR